MPSSHTLLKYLRLIHLYVGVFIAPAVLFFAFTGALQTFSLHETTRGSSYKPPAWAVVLGQIHKKQTPIVPLRKAPPQDRPAEQAVTQQKDRPSSSSGSQASQPTPTVEAKPLPNASAPKSHNALPLKIFFLLVSIGLFTSTLSGLYMSYRFIRNRKLITSFLLAGVILPVLLTIF